MKEYGVRIKCLCDSRYNIFRRMNSDGMWRAIYLEYSDLSGLSYNESNVMADVIDERLPQMYSTLMLMQYDCTVFENAILSKYVLLWLYHRIIWKFGMNRVTVEIVY